MKYDFTTVYDRTNKDSLAVDEIPIPGAKIRDGFSRLPMWVADMNFATAPAVTEAVQKRLEHPLFGYFNIKPEYYDAIINWQTARNGFEGLTKKQIGYDNGVIGCLATALSVFTEPGESILVNSPLYIGFSGCLKELGRTPVVSPLKQDENGIWRMDYEDMDRKIKQNKIHFMIFCSPQNPTGRVWEKEEIKQMIEVAKRNDVIVFDDEIWSDLLRPGVKHTPTLMACKEAKKRVISAFAITKTFNLAGLVGSYHIVYDPYLKDRLETHSIATSYNLMNVLVEHAQIGAYSKEGAKWVDELRQVLADNVDYAVEFIENHFKGVKCAKPQGTYMLYLDVSGWLKDHQMTCDELLREGVSVGVIWQDGRPFLVDNTIRMNLALPHVLVKEAFERLDKYVFNKE